MTYELVKKLKDAGFPQPQFGFEGAVFYEDSSGIAYVCHQGQYCNANPCTNCPRCRKVPSSYEPTLSELISACGEAYFRLQYITTDDEGWSAGKYKGEKHISVGYCRTPEEAVSELFIALQAVPTAPKI